MKRIFILLALPVTCLASFSPAQSNQESRYTLLDVVVFGTVLPVDMSAYPADVRSQLQQHIKRSEAYRPRPRPRPEKNFPEMNMVYSAREDYERRLVAAASRPGAERLAQQYVDDLNPCYESEGFHDCPEEEAKFAERYLAKNPNSPFAQFLPLLIANRWLCAAAGYEREQRPQDTVRARRASEAPLATALKSRSLLIRTAAQELTARGRCNSEP